MKSCSTCQELKPLTAFNIMRRAKDGRQPRCRDCCRAWYVENSDRHKVATTDRAKKQRRRNQVWIVAYLLQHPCVDCGQRDIRCLDFDHRPGTWKLKHVTKLVHEAASLASIEREIEKCDVRCANCHRRRTAERGNFWRQAVYEERELSPPACPPYSPVLPSLRSPRRNCLHEGRTCVDFSYQMPQCVDVGPITH